MLNSNSLKKEKLLVIKSDKLSKNLSDMLSSFKNDFEFLSYEEYLEQYNLIINEDINKKAQLKSEIDTFSNSNILKKILVVMETDEFGFSNEIYQQISVIKKFSPFLFDGACGAVLVNSNSSLYSKTAARKVIFELNKCGVRFMGRPFVELTKDLINLRTVVKKHKITLEEAMIKSSVELSRDLKNFYPKKWSRTQKILAIHSSTGDSNTLRLWNMISSNIKNSKVKTIDIGNGLIPDCIGCKYSICKHFGTNRDCVYGGIMVDELYPAIEESDSIVLVCPNYNDAIGANITAVINRLTALFRRTKFYDKNIFAIIVSGHSGSDSLAYQIIGALNMNKTFQLPPRFCIMKIANDKGEINEVENIEKHAKLFAAHIESESSIR